jgi:bacteriocin biosynthesis cyclodehydratase domain-containing protein
MMIRLDPRHALVWRSPDTIQLGIDRPVVVLRGLTVALEQVLAAVQVGVPVTGAVMLGMHAGATEAEVHALVHALEPGLVKVDAGAGAGAEARTEAEAASDQWILVDGDGPTAERIRRVLAALGISLAPAAGSLPVLVVIVGHFALQPARHARWLRRDVPHLPVVFSDSEVRIGPLVEPGTGPCLYCLELHRLDDDDAWPAIASQLLSRLAPTETPEHSVEAVSRTIELIQHFLRDGPADYRATSLVIDAGTGVVTRRVHRPHARCACRALPETVTVRGEHAATDRPWTSSDSGDAGPG